MASFVRKIMRGIIRGNRQQMAANGPAVGTHRAGMHQAAEHEFQRSRMAEAVPPEPETVEDALDMPAAVEAEIPPVEEDDDQIVEEIAEGEAEISAEEEIVDDISEPQAEIEEETAEINEELGARTEDRGARMAVDYSAERIPVLDPVMNAGCSDPSTPLEYSSQDGTVKEIQEPLPGMAEMYGVQPYMPDAPEIVHAGTPEVDFSLDAEGNLVVSAE